MGKPYLPTRVIKALGHHHKLGINICSFSNSQELRKYMYVGDKAIKMTKQYINAELGYQRFNL